MFKKVLAPLDGSELGKCTVDEVVNVAGPDSKVFLLRVMDDMESLPLNAALSSEVNSTVLDQIKAKNETEARQWLAGVAGGLKKKGFSDVETVVVRGKPVDEIAKFAAKNSVDLIVISTHGRSGVSRWAFGSVADKVLRTAKTPLLMVTPSGCHLEQE